MPRKPKHPCSYPGCPELTDRQYCPAHQKLVTSQYNRHDRTPEMKKRYNGAWPAIRRRFIAVHPLCEMCRRERRVTVAAEVHHIVPLSAGGTHDESNLMTLCKPCHSRITAREGGAGEAQGPLKSQNDGRNIAGPPLRAIFRDFKRTYRPMLCPNGQKGKVYYAELDKFRF